LINKKTPEMGDFYTLVGVVGISLWLALISHSRNTFLRVALIFEPFLLSQKSGSLPTSQE
jgi:hypothetical protein